MKLVRLPWFLLVAVVALVAVVFQQVWGNLGRNAEDLLADAREHLAAPKKVSPSLVLRELDTALEMARGDERQDLVEAILEQRGFLLLERRAFPSARRDFEELLAISAKPKIEFEIALLQIAVAAGEWREAILACERFLEAHAEHPTGLSVLGRACELGASHAWGEVEERLGSALGGATYEQALALCERITRFPAGAAQAVRLHRELLLVFAAQNVPVPPGLVTKLDEIITLRDRARRAFSASLANALDAQASTPLIDTFLGSGDVEQAALIAELTMQQQSARSNLEFMQRALDVLLISGRSDAASALAREWYVDRGERFINFPTYLALGRALLAGSEWELLLDLGERFHEQAPRAKHLRYHRDTAQYFIGRAAAALGDNEIAERAFTAVLSPEAMPAIDGAAIDALEWLVERTRATGRRGEELGYLVRLCNLAPQRAGDGWLRAAELLEQDSSDLESALALLTRAISAVPTRTADWFPRWHDYATTALSRRGRNLDMLAVDVTVRGVGPRELGITSSDQFLLAEHMLAAGRFGGARFVGLLLQDELADFPPLIELLLTADLALDHTLDARAEAVQLVSLGARSEVVETFLRAEWNRGALSTAAIMSVVRGASSELATLFFLAGSLEQNDPGRALAELQRWRSEHSAVDAIGLVEIAARIHLALGDPASAFEELCALPPDGQAYLDVLPLHTSALARAPTEERFARLQERMASMPALPPATAIAVGRELFRGGRADWVLEVLGKVTTLDLDEGAELFELRALASLALGELDDSAEYLERGRAFVDASSADMAELLFAVHSGGARDIARALEPINRNGRRALERCALAVLEGDLVEAKALVPTGAVALADLPLWSVLAAITKASAPVPVGLELTGSAQLEFRRTFGGEPDQPAPARLFAAAVLADASEQWSTWLTVVLGRLEARRGLWPGYFGWRAARRGVDSNTALENELELAAGFPDFDAVWTDLDRRFDERPTDHHANAYLDAWRNRVVTAPGADGATPARWRIAQAAALADNGRIEAALELARAVIAEPSQPAFVELVAARIERRAESHDRARAGYARALAQVPSDAAQELLAEYLGFLEDLLLAGRIDANTHAGAVATLGQAYPNDETVRAHRALATVTLWRATSMDLGLEARRVTFEPIRGELRDEWRQRLVGTGRALGPEASAVLARALAALDPDLGVELFEAELKAGPTRLDLWLELFELLVAAERFDDADAESARLRAVVSAPELTLWRANFLLQHRATRTADVRELLADLPSEYEVPLDTQLRLALAERRDDDVRRLCHALWEEAAGTPRAPEAAVLQANALVLLGGAEAKREARGVVRTALEIDLDPVTRAVLTSLESLCR